MYRGLHPSRPHRARLVAAAVSGLLAAGIVPGAAVAARSAYVLTVAPDGITAHTAGCVVAACSIDQAVARVREMLPTADRDIVVNVRGGLYRRTAPITLGPEDSGRAGHRVVWQAAPGQHPLVSGAQRITGFTKVDAARNVWRAPPRPAPTGSCSSTAYAPTVRTPPAARSRSRRPPRAWPPATRTPRCAPGRPTRASR